MSRLTVAGSAPRTRVGIVGAGSVGSIIGEALARIGIERITLIDFDGVERLNLDRLLHSTPRDARRLVAKVASLARGLSRSATAEAFRVDRVDASVVEETGYRAALDCDVLFSCVDRPWARQVLNFIAYAHLIPVVDGGIRVEVTRQLTLRRADWKAHIASPGRRCLECLAQFNSGLVQAEREGFLDDPKYIEGLPPDDPLRHKENVFAFSLGAGSLQLLQMLMMVVAPLGVANAGEQAYHFVPGLLDTPGIGSCNPGCPYPGLIARGDRTGLTVTGRHRVADDARLRRSAKGRMLRLLGL